jgi:hypothetical protein
MNHVKTKTVSKTVRLFIRLLRLAIVHFILCAALPVAGQKFIAIYWQRS